MAPRSHAGVSSKNYQILVFSFLASLFSVCTCTIRCKYVNSTKNCYQTADSIRQLTRDRSTHSSLPSTSNFPSWLPKYKRPSIADADDQTFAPALTS